MGKGVTLKPWNELEVQSLFFNLMNKDLSGYSVLEFIRALEQKMSDDKIKYGSKGCPVMLVVNALKIFFKADALSVMQKLSEEQREVQSLHIDLIDIVKNLQALDKVEALANEGKPIISVLKVMEKFKSKIPSSMVDYSLIHRNDLDIAKLMLKAYQSELQLNQSLLEAESEPKRKQTLQDYLEELKDKIDGQHMIIDAESSETAA